MTDDLIAFLASCHDEDERVARAAVADTRSAVWETKPEPDELIVRVGDSVTDERVFGFGSAAHIARHDPQSVLARVEAERLLIAPHRSMPYSETHDACFYCDIGAREVLWPCPTLRALAWGYRHRDGWQESWRPDGAEATTDA